MRSLAHLENAREIALRLRALEPTAPRRWGTLTVAEMLCHLADSCECAFALRPMAAIDNLFTRTAMRFVALHVPVRWPHGVPTRPEVDPRRAGTRPGSFEADRERAQRLLRELATLEAAVERARHPVLGALSLAEWKRWGYLHADHHLRQFSA